MPSAPSWADLVSDLVTGGRGAEIADLAGADLAFMAGEVAEALETFRDAPFEVMEVVPQLAATDDALAPAVTLTVYAAGGSEVEITVRLTGREAAAPSDLRAMGEPGQVVTVLFDELDHLLDPAGGREDVLTMLTSLGASAESRDRALRVLFPEDAPPPHPELGPGSGHQADGPADCPRCMLLRSNRWIEGT
jgi:hypothetical protein